MGVSAFSPHQRADLAELCTISYTSRLFFRFCVCSADRLESSYLHGGVSRPQRTQALAELTSSLHFQSERAWRIYVHFKRSSAPCAQSCLVSAPATEPSGVEDRLRLNFSSPSRLNFSSPF